MILSQSVSNSVVSLPGSSSNGSAVSGNIPQIVIGGKTYKVSLHRFSDDGKIDEVIPLDKLLIDRGFLDTLNDIPSIVQRIFKTEEISEIKKFYMPLPKEILGSSQNPTRDTAVIGIKKLQDRDIQWINSRGIQEKELAIDANGGVLAYGEMFDLWTMGLLPVLKKVGILPNIQIELTEDRKHAYEECAQILFNEGYIVHNNRLIQRDKITFLNKLINRVYSDNSLQKEILAYIEKTPRFYDDLLEDILDRPFEIELPPSYLDDLEGEDLKEEGKALKDSTKIFVQNLKDTNREKLNIHIDDEKNIVVTESDKNEYRNLPTGIDKFDEENLEKYIKVLKKLQSEIDNKRLDDPKGKKTLLGLQQGSTNDLLLPLEYYIGELVRSPKFQKKEIDINTIPLMIKDEKLRKKLELCQKLKNIDMLCFPRRISNKLINSDSGSIKSYKIAPRPLNFTFTYQPGEKSIYIGIHYFITNALEGFNDIDAYLYEITTETIVNLDAFIADPSGNTKPKAMGRITFEKFDKNKRN